MREKKNQLYPIDQVAKWSGLSVQMIGYLCAQGVVTPKEKGRRGRGRKRQFAFGDVVMLRTMQLLLERGVTVSKLKASIATLEKKFREVTPGTLPRAFLITDGTRIYFRDHNGLMQDLSEGGQYVFSFVIDLQSLSDDLTNRWNKLKAA